MEKLKRKVIFLLTLSFIKISLARVVPIALEQYFINDVPVADTIRNHRNIYDFAMRQKASKEFHYEGIV